MFMNEKISQQTPMRAGTYSIIVIWEMSVNCSHLNSLRVSMNWVTPFQNCHLVRFHIGNIVVRCATCSCSPLISHVDPCSVQVMPKRYNYAALQERAFCVQTGPADLLSWEQAAVPVAAVVMVTEEGKRERLFGFAISRDGGVHRIQDTHTSMRKHARISCVPASTY